VGEDQVDVTRTFQLKAVSYSHDPETGLLAVTFTEEALREAWGEAGNALQGHETS
jgi:hypothetical protein